MFAGLDTGGSQGPWLVWTPKGTEDGSVPRASFYIRESEGKTVVTDKVKKGIVIDIHSLQTGWQMFGPNGPEWKMGDNPSKLPAKPGEEWKKGFKVKVAFPDGATCMWEQSGAAAWTALAGLNSHFMAGPTNDPDKLPVVQFTGIEELKFRVGGTTAPILAVAKWIDRPDSLSNGGGFAIDSGDEGASNAPAAAPAPAPAEEMADDDVSF